jgi:hypothetical protein
MLRMVEGFDQLFTTAGLNRRHSSFTADSIPFTAPGRFGGVTSQIGIGGATGDQLVLTTRQFVDQQTVVVGLSLRIDNPNFATTWDLIRLMDTSNEQVALEARLQGGGGSNPKVKFALVRGVTDLFETADQVWEIGENKYIELKVFVDNTTGTSELRINESIVSGTQLTGLDTQGHTSNNVNQIKFALKQMSSSAGFAVFFDDLYVIDDTGANNNDFLGEIIVEARLPNANGDQVDWTPNSNVANETRVDDPGAPDGDNSYNSSSNAGDIDLFQFTDLSLVTGNIIGVAVVTTARIESSGARSLRNLYKRSGGSIQETASHSVASTSYQDYENIHELNPDTALAWTVPDIDDGQFGYKLQA